MSLVGYILFMTLLNMLLFHFPLYHYALEHLEIASLNGFLTFLMVLIALFVVSTLLFVLLALISTRLLKYFMVIIIFLNPIALYFITTYNVILDRTMMGNLFNTNLDEALSYYHPKIFFYLFMALLFAYLVSRIEVKKSNRVTLLKYGLSVVFVGVLILYLNASRWLWLDKHAKRLGAMSMPWSYLINAIRYQVRALESTKEMIPLPNATFKKKQGNTLVVLVIGESARAKNFSLYGYAKQTNPKLKELDVIALKNAFSTTTYTTASVHSMLSYKGSSSDAYEPLPSYLQRQGVEVIWRSNNWGEPPLKVASYERKSDLEALCHGDECAYDGGLLTGLKERLEHLKGRTLVVLHTTGSHGPSYFQKYPERFEQFTPVCKTVELKKCTQEELENAYDNTIVYTDHFLANIIALLQEQPQRETLLVYISDHGESLGEYGLYLHGTPYSIAPDVQKEVPFILWASPKFRANRELDRLDFNAKESYGHHNIFHSIMGAFEMNSSIYNKKRDIFSR